MSAATPPTETPNIYLTALKVLFWVSFVGVLSVAAGHVWPTITRILTILSPFLIGLILAYIFHPIVKFVQFRLRLGRVAGVCLVGGAVVLVLAGFIGILIPILYQQITGIIEDISHAVSGGKINEAILNRVFDDPEKQEHFRKALADWIESVQQSLSEALNPAMLKPVAAGSVGAVRGTLGAIGSVFGWVSGTMATLVLSVVVTFYLLISMDKIPAIIRKVLPGHDPERVWSVMLRADHAVGGFLRGQLIACTGVGILATIILFVIGLKEYALLIGLTAGAFNFIPYLGPASGAVPAVLWAFFTQNPPSWAAGLALPGWGMRLLLVGVVAGGFMIVQAVDGFVFQPFIVGRQAALHPLTVMLALLIGAQLGIGGLILAVPVACIVKVFFMEYYWKDRQDFIDAGQSP